MRNAAAAILVFGFPATSAAITYSDNVNLNHSPLPGSEMALSVGRLYFPDGQAAGTGIHIGSGKFLVAGHAANNAEDPSAAETLNYVLSYVHCREDRDRMVRAPSAETDPGEDENGCTVKGVQAEIVRLFCNVRWDFCLFQLSDPQTAARVPGHLYISILPPTLNTRVITVGFPHNGNSFYNRPTLSRGMIVDGEVQNVLYENGGGKNVPRPSYGMTVSGEKGISNSPVMAENNPSLMMLYFWGVPKTPPTPISSSEAAELYRRGLKNGTDPEKNQLFLNWAVGAHHIAEFLLNSPYGNLFCSRGNDRIYACRQ